ncbi:MAG: hypothetical protein AAF968_09745 [Pseudomonadota bacterium]
MYNAFRSLPIKRYRVRGRLTRQGSAQTSLSDFSNIRWVALTVPGTDVQDDWIVLVSVSGNGAERTFDASFTDADLPETFTETYPDGLPELRFQFFQNPSVNPPKAGVSNPAFDMGKSVVAQFDADSPDVLVSLAGTTPILAQGVGNTGLTLGLEMMWTNTDDAQNSGADFELAATVETLDEGFRVTVDRDVLDSVRSSTQNVALRRSDGAPTADQALWVAIRQRTDAIGFGNYQAFMDAILCKAPELDERPQTHALKALRTRAFGNVYMSNVDAYTMLKVATDAFLLLHCGPLAIDPLQYDADDESGRLNDHVPHAEITQKLARYLGNNNLPYIERVLTNNLPALQPIDSPFCVGIIRDEPCFLELIWSYWHEEGMLVQTMNALSLRFQNRRLSDRDPLAAVETDPLRPLNNLLWGYVQDENQRLSVPRRAYEYDHHYGLRLIGRAVPEIRSADSRSKFIESFHNLLYRAAAFYQEDDDTTVVADGFPMLNALKDLHLVLAQGAHNQFGDLPWTARSEMMVMQWLLARDETREFLRGRYMVPYQEAWMGQVETMRKLQSWSDTPIKHFRDLAVFGEQLLLSVRYADWVGTSDANTAKNWARYWRPEIQGYIYAYLSATGADLSADGAATPPEQRYAQPAALLSRQLARQGRPALPSGRSGPGNVGSGIAKTSGGKR